MKRCFLKFMFYFNCICYFISCQAQVKSSHTSKTEVKCHEGFIDIHAKILTNFLTKEESSFKKADFISILKQLPENHQIYYGDLPTNIDPSKSKSNLLFLLNLDDDRFDLGNQTLKPLVFTPKNAEIANDLKFRNLKDTNVFQEYQNRIEKIGSKNTYAWFYECSHTEISKVLKDYIEKEQLKEICKKLRADKDSILKKLPKLCSSP
jgi:hypothetical protein